MVAGDLSRVYEAIGILSARNSEVVALLKERVRPAKVADVGLIRKHIASLDSDSFAVREAALRELTEAGGSADGELRKALDAKPSLEVRKKLQSVLTFPGLETLRQLRAIQILEVIASSEARQFLQTLAAGAPEARLTQEAKASLKRLAKRTPIHP